MGPRSTEVCRYARSAVAALPEFLRVELRDVRRVILTVNHENPAAIGANLAGGFVDTGEDDLGGAAGPQHVLELTLRARAPFRIPAARLDQGERTSW